MLTKNLSKFLTAVLCAACVLQVGVVQAKDLREKANEFAHDYFMYESAIELFRGKQVSEVLRNSGRADWRFLGEMKQSGVEQAAHLSLSPDFMMLTLSKAPGTGKLLAISVTRNDIDVPFKEIKYLAFESSSSGSGKSKVRTFFMGDASKKGLPMRHFLQESAEFTGGEYKQVSWLYAIKQ